MIDYGLIFLTGVFASLHCIGMCGAVVLAYSTQPASVSGSNSNFSLHTAYNSGRILSYALLGALVGIAGMLMSWVQNAGEYFSIVGGGIMIVAGFAMLGLIPIPSSISLFGSSKIISQQHGQLLRKRTITSKLALGFLTPLLPCGILYAMLAKAASAGNALNGALTMGIFAIGMAPSLMLLGSVSSFFTARMRKGAEQLAAVMIIVMGLVLIARGFHLPYLGWLVGESKCPHCAS
jgi:sulfite exporter TauE/SafE